MVPVPQKISHLPSQPSDGGVPDIKTYVSVLLWLTGGDYEAVVLREDQELAGFVPLLSIAYSPVYVPRGTHRVSRTSSEQLASFSFASVRSNVIKAYSHSIADVLLILAPWTFMPPAGNLLSRSRLFISRVHYVGLCWTAVILFNFFCRKQMCEEWCSAVFLQCGITEGC